MLMTIPGYMRLAIVASSLEKLSTLPKSEPDISEFVWFDSHISEYSWDKEDQIKTVSSVPFILATATVMETLQDKKKNLKLQMRLG